MRKRDEASLIILGIIAVIILGIISIIGKVLSVIISAIVYYIESIRVIIFTCVSVFLAYHIFSFFYFNSYRFKRIKDSISGYIENCNDLNHYIDELKHSYVNISSYDFG